MGIFSITFSMRSFSYQQLTTILKEIWWNLQTFKSQMLELIGEFLLFFGKSCLFISRWFCPNFDPKHEVFLSHRINCKNVSEILACFRAQRYQQVSEKSFSEKYPLDMNSKIVEIEIEIVGKRYTKIVLFVFWKRCVLGREAFLSKFRPKS